MNTGEDVDKLAGETIGDGSSETGEILPSRLLGGGGPNPSKRVGNKRLVGILAGDELALKWSGSAAFGGWVGNTEDIDPLLFNVWRFLTGGEIGVLVLGDYQTGGNNRRRRTNPSNSLASYSKVTKVRGNCK